MIEKEDLKKYLEEAPVVSQDLCKDIYNKHLKETEDKKCKNSILSLFRKKIILIPSLLLLFTIISLSSIFYVEAKAYNKAIDFFNENELCLEGLSKSEIRKVYKDVTTNTFSYDVTKNVIIQSTQNTIPGYLINHLDMEHIDVRNLWDYWIELRFNYKNKVRIEYKIEHKFTNDLTLYGSSISKVVDDEVLWKVINEDYIISYHKNIDNYTFIYGYKRINNNKVNYLSLIDDNSGIVLWKKEINGINIKNIFANGDTYSIIGSNDLDLVIINIDTLGNILNSYNKNLLIYSIQLVFSYEEGYMIKALTFLNETSRNIDYKIINVNNDLSVVEEFIHEEDDYKFSMCDMIEYNNKVYISTLRYPKPINNSSINDVDRLLSELGLLDDSSDYDLKLKMIQDNFQAVILVCERDNSSPITFIQIEKSLPGSLSVNDDGLLEWNVKTIVDAFYSPYTSSFTFGGVLEVFKYTFDSFGNIISQIDTNEQEPFIR